MVIYSNTKGENEAYLSQVAYDRYHIVDDKLDMDKLDGWLLKADWDDTLKEGVFFKSGKRSLKISPQTKEARINDCIWYYYSYQTYNVWSDGTLEIVLHQHYDFSCSESYSSGGNWEAYPYEVPGPWDGGGSPYYVPITTTYNIKNAICNTFGGDRFQMNQNLSDALSATGLASGVTGWTFSKADAILRSVGANIDDFRPLTNGAKAFGIAGGALGVLRGFIGLFDGDISDHDALDIIGGLVGAGIAVSTGWVAVAIGGTVTLAIAIYEANNDPLSLYNYCN